MNRVIILHKFNGNYIKINNALKNNLTKGIKNEQKEKVGKNQ
jgi:hypothetical protein